MAADRLENIVSLAKRRGFVYPSSEIYGGLRAAWDYGPLGVEVKNNVKRQWWKYMVQGREDVVGLDSCVILAREVWEASGHVATFTDPLTTTSGKVGDIITVTGTTLYANVTNILVEDNTITLNSNVTGTPTLNAGIEVNRGNQPNTSIIWNETDKKWEFTNDGSTYNIIADDSKVQAAFDKANNVPSTGFSRISTFGQETLFSSNSNNITFVTGAGISITNDQVNTAIGIGTTLIGAANVVLDYGTVDYSIGTVTFDYGYL